MKYQKPVPADAHFLHDPPTDHPTHVNSHEDIRPPTRTCAENDLAGGKCPNNTCDKRGPEDTPEGARTEVLKRHSLRATHRRTKSQRYECPRERDLTRKTLEMFLTPKELDRLGIDVNALEYLWSASIDPPVTKTSLSELDLVRIVNDPRLRHDVNFDREVLFRPNLHGEVGKMKMALEKGYWDALVIEFAIYITRWRDRSTNSPESPWHLGPTKVDKVPLRLPRMFQTVREILKTLVPVAEWPIVDARLDVDLLVQQLEKGVCDIISLSEWLSALLLGSCSPMRDPLVATMVSSIRQGVETDDARRIVDGLRQLFGILETMKLDVANHQIRYLRLLMVDDFVHFEQTVFLRLILHDGNLRNAHSWFNAFEAKSENLDNRPRGPQFSTFLRGVVDLIATNNHNYPSTFEHDFDRLRLLQLDFQSCLTETACRETFIETLHQLGQTRLPSAKVCDGLLARILYLITGPGSSPSPSPVQHAKDVALEIVRECYEISGNRSLPSDAHLHETETRLLEYWNQASAVFDELQDDISTDLAELVDQEVRVIMHKSPLQMLNHLNPPPPHIPVSQLHLQRQPWAPESRFQSSLLSIAKRVAHIAVLHWRVWAPILYEQPWGPDGLVRRAGSAGAGAAQEGGVGVSMTGTGMAGVVGVQEDGKRRTGACERRDEKEGNEAIS